MNQQCTTFYGDDLQHLEDQVNDWIKTAKAGGTTIEIINSSLTCIPVKSGSQSYGYGSMMIYKAFKAIQH